MVVSSLAGCQPYRADWLPLRGSLCGAPPLRPNVRRRISLPTSLARVPADPRLPKPIEHTRPRGIHAPTRSFGVIQTMLLALENFGLERMGRNNPSGCAGKFLVGALCAQKPKSQKAKKLFRPQAAKISSGCCCFSRPNRASPPVKKAGSHAWRDAGQGSWYRMYLTIRGRQRIFSARISWNAGQRGW